MNSSVYHASMSRFLRSLAVSAVAPSLVALSQLFALPAPARTLEEVQACMRANLPESSSVQTVSFESVNRAGESSESRAKLYWKRFDDGLSKVMMRFSDPLDLRGAGILLIEKDGRMPDQFMYLPELRKVRRVSTRMLSSSMFGTDFSYEDFQRLQGMTIGSRKKLLEDAELAGGAVHVVENLTDPESGSAYERIVDFIDVETCVMLKSEMYERGGRLRKVSRTSRDHLAKQDGRFMPRRVRMRDVRDETHSTLVVEDIDLDARISRKIFSERHLGTGRD